MLLISFLCLIVIDAMFYHKKDEIGLTVIEWKDSDLLILNRNKVFIYKNHIFIEFF